MRLNDPQIELVHDDPFMGYIETSTSSSVRAETEPAPEPPAVATAASDDDDEDVDVGEDSRPPQSPGRRTSVRNNRSNGTDQSIVIVLLVE